MNSVVFQKMTWRILFINNTQVYRVKNSHRSVKAIKRTFETILLRHVVNQRKRIFICDPSCIHRIHENSLRFELFSASSCDHIQGCFCHIGVRMMLTFIASMKNSLHRRNIDNPWRSLPNHLMLKFTDKMERNNWVHNLGSIAIK